MIPAKYYYDDDTQEQWKAKKKSKDELKQNKRAKLDPELAKESDKSSSAAQVQQKRAKTAKPAVIPGQKKMQAIVESDSDDDEEQEQEDDSEVEASTSAAEEESEDDSIAKPETVTNGKSKHEGNDSEEDINVIFDDEGNEIDTNTQKVTPQPQQQQQQKPKPTSSSTTTTPKESNDKKQKKELTEEEKKRKEESLRALKEKLESKINNMREKRKAPGSKASGAPSSREAILEERRKKAEIKAERKRKLAEMQDKSDGSDASDDDESEAEKDNAKADGVIFQNIVFDDKTRATSDLSNVRVNKKKGPAKNDIKAHLKLLEKKKQKLAELDSDKKEDLAEKERWNKTLAAAEGQKLKDDEKLLKKALKRKEAQKRKSEIQWQERKDHVQNMISMKAKRREENLEIRKQNKGLKRKSQQKQLRKFKTKIAPKRPGFEGRRTTKGK